MGHELYRLIRDGAPESWTPLMRALAMMIADDARPDPSQGVSPDGGWPLSKIRLHGHYGDDGRWYDGLTERTGMSERVISRILAELARADYEMREQIGTDKHGRPVFAYPWRARRFRVPPLPPRRPPDPVAYSSPDPVAYSSPDPVAYGSPDPVATAERPMVARSGGVGDQNRRPARSPDPVAPFPIPLPVTNTHPHVLNSSLEPRTREAADLDGRAGSAPGSAAPGQTDDFDFRGTRARPGPGYGLCPECREWMSVQGLGLLARHGLRNHWCHGSRRAPAEPVPCVGCGETGVALTAFAGLCKACRADRKAGTR